MRLMFVADGPRDRATIPEIVRTLLQRSFEVSFQEWKKIRLARGSGYNRKLRFILIQSRDDLIDGVVATIDSDSCGAGDRLRLLRDARSEDRLRDVASPIPVAIGEAVPHCEAWLLDDPKAVVGALDLPADTRIPNVRDVVPKDFLDELIQSCNQSSDLLELLSRVARSVDPSRCNHSKEIGLHQFCDEVKHELFAIE